MRLVVQLEGEAGGRIAEVLRDLAPHREEALFDDGVGDGLLAGVERVAIELAVVVHVQHDGHAAREQALHDVVDAGHEHGVDGGLRVHAGVVAPAHGQAHAAHALGVAPAARARRVADQRDVAVVDAQVPRAFGGGVEHVAEVDAAAEAGGELACGGRSARQRGGGQGRVGGERVGRGGGRGRRGRVTRVGRARAGGEQGQRGDGQRGRDRVLRHHRKSLELKRGRACRRPLVECGLAGVGSATPLRSAQNDSIGGARYPMLSCCAQSQHPRVAEASVTAASGGGREHQKSIRARAPNERASFRKRMSSCAPTSAFCDACLLVTLVPYASSRRPPWNV